MPANTNACCTFSLAYGVFLLEFCLWMGVLELSAQLDQSKLLQNPGDKKYIQQMKVCWSKIFTRQQCNIHVPLLQKKQKVVKQCSEIYVKKLIANTGFEERERNVTVRSLQFFFFLIVQSKALKREF